MPPNRRKNLLIDGIQGDIYNSSLPKISIRFLVLNLMNIQFALIPLISKPKKPPNIKHVSRFSKKIIPFSICYKQLRFVRLHVSLMKPY